MNSITIDRRALQAVAALDNRDVLLTIIKVWTSADPRVCSTEIADLLRIPAPKIREIREVATGVPRRRYRRPQKAQPAQAVPVRVAQPVPAAPSRVIDAADARAVELLRAGEAVGAAHTL